MTIVPTMGPAPPKTPVTGFHSALVKKLKPNCWKRRPAADGQADHDAGQRGQQQVAAEKQAALKIGSIAAPRGRAGCDRGR